MYYTTISMNKQIFAALSLVCGLLGFNLIAIMQTMSYMRIKNYLKTEPDLDLSLFAIDGFFKYSSLGLGVTALVMCYLYSRADDINARLNNIIGGVLGLVSIVLALFPIYLWLV